MKKPDFLHHLLLNFSAICSHLPSKDTNKSTQKSSIFYNHIRSPIILLLLSSLFFINSLLAYQYEIAIVSIFKNEADWLKEWIDYHKKIGVDHFYLYNHLSTDHYQEVLQPYIEEGSVELIHWNHEKFPESQLLALKHAITSLKKKVKWLAMIDTDEFIVPKSVDNIKDFLAQFENAAGIMINWQLFGTSNIHSLPNNESLLQNLTWKFPTYFDSAWNSNYYCKSIIRPDRIDEFTKNKLCGNHVFMPIKGVMVNSKGKPQKIDPKMSSIDVSDIQINHYWFRTIDWFYGTKEERKIGKGSKYSAETIEWLFKMGHSEQDFEILRFLTFLP